MGHDWPLCSPLQAPWGCSDLHNSRKGPGTGTIHDVTPAGGWGRPPGFGKEATSPLFCICSKHPLLLFMYMYVAQLYCMMSEILAWCWFFLSGPYINLTGHILPLSIRPSWVSVIEIKCLMCSARNCHIPIVYWFQASWVIVALQKKILEK